MMTPTITWHGDRIEIIAGGRAYSLADEHDLEALRAMIAAIPGDQADLSERLYVVATGIAVIAKNSIYSGERTRDFAARLLTITGPR